jgi:hypothetical protein
MSPGQTLLSGTAHHILTYIATVLSLDNAVFNSALEWEITESDIAGLNRCIKVLVVSDIMGIERYQNFRETYRFHLLSFLP